MKIFDLHSEYQPAGDQTKAIEFLSNNIKKGVKDQVLWGVTGSGKTFTIANVIKNFDKPVLILSHNKTLTNQLYSELKGFFPNNAVEYYISYFDYFRPEAYLPNTDTYIEKDSRINKKIDIMRMSAINSLISRKDVIVVASVSAIYGALNPEIYVKSFYRIFKGQKISVKDFCHKLINIKYHRNDIAPLSAEFSVKGDSVILRPADSEENAIRIDFFGDEIEDILLINALNKNILDKYDIYTISPGDAYATDNSVYDRVIPLIEHELNEQLKKFESEQKLLEYQRLSQRIKNDINDLKEFRFCKGIENYSMYLDGRNFGDRPYTLLDYFPKDSLIIIDESHLSIPQIRSMIIGDQSRKNNLVNYGFRLPSALENRPLSGEEFENNFDFKKIYISATPVEYELNKAKNNVVKMVVRPTGLLDPEIIIKPTQNQINDIYETILKQRELNEKTIILTITKETSEKLNEYLIKRGIKSMYIHSEHTNFERDEIIKKLRLGYYEVLIGINLLREGVDIPEVSKVIILDADKGGFIRAANNLIQIVGRASRNANGQAILYADTISPAMRECIDDNKNKRKIQLEYNKLNHITPRTIIKKVPTLFETNELLSDIEKILTKKSHKRPKAKIQIIIKELTKSMLDAAKQRDYLKAQEIKDLIFKLESDTNDN
ncbi:excinuclease ABC subunit UvrB [Mycoplasmopsis cynos]|uniref:excinuclease ABC subunit UvrB n=1 Tax=Mycoplasmopsis cynos TaxID=171284 RepID=UPI002AFF4910|nr:excinuclease ABC subunit UvrB [Mycoplasmopsis cynos]WQQ19552.1 excinuclease ABC subunit UvrB [Mycoplasmopsis cynos]